MGATLLDGRAVAAQNLAALAPQVQQFTQACGRPPGLAVLLVGDDPASAVYVRNKERRATALGLHSQVVRLPADASQVAVEAAVEALNQDRRIDAFLVQLPLPPGLNAAAVTACIDPQKDADGLHPYNLGCLMAGMPGPQPCTPAGVMVLLQHAGVALAGAHAVVLGRSTIVGKPQALLLLGQHATVTVCHSRTPNLPEEVRRADVLVAAVGRAHFVRGAWLKPGAAVIDVGINRLDGKLVGDVAFAEACEVAGCITPVPGGVGPMTIAQLIANTVAAAWRRAGK
jgi:methylenetetrahydrofolate dehydrogenase (NADP+)/methenyltetrahydrofolate cyclohydrolase